MDKKELEVFIKQLIADEVEVDVEELKDDAYLEDYELDSLGITTVLMGLEDEGYEIDAEKIFDSTDKLTIGSFIEKILNIIA